ncbi:acetyl-CoA sensor PanZ family protein [Bacterioplanoides pacificum]|uniref:Acetyl-CoA sensor PanZ family protein n=1 Tax=Bacterioplanoides pacificum TaxID=1171596 RepID=A0ABV7VUX8_9GAMM
MPVRLEHIQQPSDADWQDIGKIHQDTASSGLVSTPQQLAQRLTDGSWIIAGRFNDRIIGLLIATETEQGVQLEQAAVRTITQNRGVLHQLLHHLCEWAEKEGKTLIFQNVSDGFRQPLQNRGFQCDDHHCRYN